MATEKELKIKQLKAILKGLKRSGRGLTCSDINMKLG